MCKKFMTYVEVCVFLILVMSSSACASLVVQFHKADYYYVGEEAIATISSIGGIMTHVYTVVGNLPPGCYLDQNGASTANIKGTPTTAGTYSFTVNVQAKTLDYSSGRMGYEDVYGSVSCVMTIRPARSGNDNTDNNNGNNNNGNNDNGNNGNGNNDNSGNNNNGNNNNGNNTNNGNTGNNGKAVSGGGGGGGCDSGIGITALLAIVIAFKRSR